MSKITNKLNRFKSGMNLFTDVCKVSILKIQKKNDLARWSNDANLLKEWEPRTELIATLIPPGNSVLEFGAGSMRLKKYLLAGTRYTPSDLVNRGAGTLVCDLNAKELPEFPQHDVAVFSGVLEYVYDVPRLVKHVSKNVKIIILSYSITNIIPFKFVRRANGWVNDYSSSSLKEIFKENSFYCDNAQLFEQQEVYKFIKRD